MSGILGRDSRTFVLIVVIVNTVVIPICHLQIRTDSLILEHGK